MKITTLKAIAILAAAFVLLVILVAAWVMCSASYCGIDDANEHDFYIAAQDSNSAGATFYIDGKEMGTLNISLSTLILRGKVHELRVVKGDKELEKTIYPIDMWIVDFEKSRIYSD